ncbi:AroM family protein [Brooklawnia cerclae]|uniref:Protein AroM n=1 Tax=Brooklawnia cerclae TaxID=349934 RepID=A0ABX0SL08_9ACTN|nr:protein AroM [Brooklawnia cerclae]
MTRGLGLVLIGWSDRPDVIARIREALLPVNARIVCRGALDGLDGPAVERLAPKDDADTLIAFVPPSERGHLPDESGRKISKTYVEARAAELIGGLQAEGCDVTTLFCAADFPGVTSPGLVVLPAHLVGATVDSVLPTGRLGVLVPLAEQREHFRERWSAPGREVVTVPLLPNADESHVAAAIAEMRSAAPTLVLMDCLDYDEEIAERVRADCGVPVLWSFSIVAQMLRELLR